MTAGDTVEIDDIVISSDIAARLGVVQSAVINWQKRYADFPAPFKVIGTDDGRRGFSLFRWSEVLAWYVNRRHGSASMSIEVARAIIEAHERGTIS
jgi:hypothetical protein